MTVCADKLSGISRNNRLAVAAPSSRRRRNLSALAAAVAAAAAFLTPTAEATPNSVVTVNTGQTDLTASATYTPSATPTGTNDVEFTGAYAPAAFTLNSSQTFGSLDDLSATGITISDTGVIAATLTLGAGGTNAVTGTNGADLLYVAAGGNLTISPGAGVLRSPSARPATSTSRGRQSSARASAGRPT